MKRVLHVLSSNQFSGAENVVCQIIKMFQDNADYKMIYCSLDGNIRESLKEQNITFEPINNMSVKEIKRVIHQKKPDIIHAHDMRASFISARACGKIPLISHIHNNSFDSRRISLKAVAYLRAGIKAKHIFWVSQSSKDGYAFIKFLTYKSSVLYNVININNLYEKMQQDTNSYEYDVVYIGRLTPPKNPLRLMRVFRILLNKMPSIKIAVIGTGELKEETHKAAVELQLLDNVSFLGFQSNPLKMLHDSKVMIMTSLWEGTPMCALEAMALGVPIVSTPVDGLKTLIKNGENGYLSNDDYELARSVIKIIKESRTYEHLRGTQIAYSKIINDIDSYKNEILRAYEDRI